MEPPPEQPEGNGGAGGGREKRSKELKYCNETIRATLKSDRGKESTGYAKGRKGG